jgi:sugar phosphate isomerase/epimerase
MSIRAAITVCLVPEARQGPFVFHEALDTAFAKASAHGFHGVEIFPTHADDLDGLHLRDLLREYNLQLAAMGTGAGWLRRQLSLTSPDPHVRMQARDFIGAVIDFAGGFGAPAIIGSMQGRVADGIAREQALAWFREELDQLGPRAHALGVPLLYEPLNRYETNLFNTVGEVLPFLQTLRTKNVRLLCDLFHMNLEEQDIASALRLADRQLGHVHLADSNRRAMGLGHTPMESIAAALKESGYDGYVSAEVLPRPDAETAARQTMETFRRFFIQNH